LIVTRNASESTGREVGWRHVSPANKKDIRRDLEAWKAHEPSRLWLPERAVSLVRIVNGKGTRQLAEIRAVGVGVV